MIMTHPKRGFTLVETMVAVAILAVALVGPFVAIRTSLTASYIARDQLIASSLAQEGMEYIRSIRDNNYLNNRSGGWLDGITAYTSCYSSSLGVAPSGFCAVDPSRGDIHTDSPNHSAMQHYSGAITSVPYLKLSETGLYNQQPTSATNPDSRFRRGVQITALRNDPVTGSPIEVRVQVVVSWVAYGQTHSVVVTDNLHDWI